MILEELELLRRSTEVNETLRRAAQECAAKAQRATRGGVAKRMRDDLAQAVAQTQAQLAEYEKNAASSNASSSSFAIYNPMTLLQACEQQVPLASLTKPADQGDVSSLAALVESIAALRKRKGFLRAKDTPLALSVEESLRLLDKADVILKETALDSIKWTPLPEGLLKLLADAIDQPHVTEEVLEFQEQLKRMIFSVEEITEQQQQAVMDGDMKLTETLYFKKITTQEAMVDVFNRLFTALDAYHSEYFVAPLKRVHDVHTEANGKVAALMKAFESLKAAVEGDMQRLKDVASKINEADRLAQAQFRSALDENDRQLDENRAAQEQCIAAIEELERHLAQLGANRVEIVTKRLDVVDANRRREGDVANFRRFYKDHMVLLEGTVQTCEAAEEVTDAFDELICNGCNAIEQHMRGVEAAIEKERLAAHDLRLQHFRELYLTLGDLQYKKERNLDELDKKIAHTAIQQEIAMETFNPKAKELANMKKDLMAVREEMDSQVQVLHEKAQLHIEAFKPTEVALIEAGRSFVHPVEELDALNRNRQQKLLEYHKLVQSDEQDAGEFDAQEELRRIEEERKSIRPRRPVSESTARNRGSNGSFTGGAPDMPLANEPYSSATSSPTKQKASPTKSTNGID